jgi:transposase-like protein
MITDDDAITKPAHRLKVFTGAGRRRTWSGEDKARIVAEIVTSGASVSAVAKRHGLSPQQLFGWRRQLQASRGGFSKGVELSRFERAPLCAALSMWQDLLIEIQASSRSSTAPIYPVRLDDSICRGQLAAIGTRVPLD